MKSLSPIISKQLLWGIAIPLAGAACSSVEQADPREQLLRGTISYPFAANPRSLGKHHRFSEPFVIRTIAGGTEYIVEIPGAARDFDVEIPLAVMKGTNGKERVNNAQLTDRELVNSMPGLSKATEKERALMDKAFGVGEKGGPKQAPSYMLGLQKIGRLYKQHKYEFALIEINNLMSYYPTSAKLYKMKGTILVKLRNLRLAERAWVRAAELAPNDPVVRKGLIRLRRRMEHEQKLALAKREELQAVAGAAAGSATAGQEAGGSSANDEEVEEVSNAEDGPLPDENEASEIINPASDAPPPPSVNIR